MLVWEGDEYFQNSMDQFVLQPFTQPGIFHPLLNPMRHLVLVYGRPGVGKKEAVLAYCDKHQIPRGAISVDFGHAHDAIQMIDAIIQRQNDIIGAIEDKLALALGDHKEEEEEEAVAAKINHVIIIDRFDVLLFEPDTEITMSYMLRLARTAAKNNLMFVCLCDRLPQEEAAQQAVSHTTRMYRQGVLKQFSARTLLSAPHSLYRQALFKQMLEQFVQHYNNTMVVDGAVESNTPPLVLDLSEGDYLKLSDASAFATPTDISNFLRAIFYDICSPNPPPLCRPADAPVDPATGRPTGPMRLHFDVLDDKMSNAIGSRHISKEDPRLIEDKYSIESGRGSIAAPMPKRITASSEATTAFSTKLVGVAEAGEALEKKKKKKRQRQVVEEEEPQDCWAKEAALEN